MRKRPVEERIKDFEEVALGFSKEEAIAEATRCLQCKKPLCINGCPVQINIPKFIKEIAEEKFSNAIKTLKETNSLPGICGRVCPQETQCEMFCILGKKGKPIDIGTLERFASDWEIKLDQRPKAKSQEPRAKNQEQVKLAVVGSGPAGLTCAGELAKMGYDVTIFESLHKAGGVLRYGIPEFRMPRDILDSEIQYVKDLGVQIRCDVLIGKTFSIDELFEAGYKAIFIASGAGLPQFLNIEGENANGVYSANEFLTRANLMKAYDKQYHTPIKIGKKVGVIGGGNVAMDSARVALRLGAEEVYLVYRRSEQEMPAREEERENAKEEGIQFKILTQPVRIKTDDKGWVKEIECLQMQLGEPDESGRRRPVPIKDSNFSIPLDTIVIAIGQNPNPLIPSSTPNLKTGKKGTIEANEAGATSIEGVFAGGDIVTGAATVIEAMGAGRKAAKAMDEYIKNKL
ncbi:MAG: NADPH-dependent glutamate synthase [Candidatus Omnitrophica bacterium]|nr:NADPH-dependent glutamate synthase [Candidatus Omnitrophota bacterium]MBU1047092.1 NADPH-dependent glutamate synthase [Candidatus Omnitrophota bacterium]MBU1631544.1 NADPH-dependent glutamate synthase [Candidatus Omnitrophota bacterium]MBU1767720.1 NADPH-dependent glutamate synthase [Candidatus Omnitrophota bacterium]MBU1888758.1 NADPH-dependent glutamate synthase [Candidatus Omnitrophota bacterium]